MAVARESFDIVLMDIQMPEMDGFEATAAIRNHPNPFISCIPIVALTAHAVNGYEERCLSSGMNGFVTKPVDKDKLRTAMECALSRSVPHSVAEMVGVAE